MARSRIAPRRTLATLRIAALTNRLTFLAISLPYSARSVIAKPEVWHIQLRHRYADEIPALPADHLAVRHILAKVFADPAADNLPKAALISLNFHHHTFRRAAGFTPAGINPAARLSLSTYDSCL